ncbi:hypothetical protein ACU635_15445 [[Actinomadura] parvosata]|uniref:hypothetical protein n=1 Tax=[Actinomadura] parvosata TaxID=1955412 RepID=UPI00406D3EEC
MLRQQRRRLPGGALNDPGCRRLKYVRHWDDRLLGFRRPKHEAGQITSKIAAFLREELKLGLSPSKTLITNAASQAARFLGYEIRAQQEDTQLARGRRSINGVMGLFVPVAVICERCAHYMKRGEPAPTRLAAARR